MVEGRHKHHGHLAIDQLQHFEPVQLGHLHVEQQQVGPVLGHCFDRRKPIAALSDDLDVILVAQIFVQNLPRQLFVIHDDRADFRRRTARRRRGRARAQQPL